MTKPRFREVGYDLPLVTQSGSDDAKRARSVYVLCLSHSPPVAKATSITALPFLCARPLSEGQYLYVLSTWHPLTFYKYLWDPNSERDLRIIALRFHVRLLGLPLKAAELFSCNSEV